MSPWFPLIVTVALSLVFSIGAFAVYAHVRVERAMTRAGLRLVSPDTGDLPRSTPRGARRSGVDAQLAEVRRLHAAGALTAADYDLIRRSILAQADPVD